MTTAVAVAAAAVVVVGSAVGWVDYWARAAVGLQHRLRRLQL
jgi:hypothetical protein